MVVCLRLQAQAYGSNEHAPPPSLFNFVVRLCSGCIGQSSIYIHKHFQDLQSEIPFGTPLLTLSFGNILRAVNHSIT